MWSGMGARGHTPLSPSGWRDAVVAPTSPDGHDMETAEARSSHGGRRYDEKSGESRGRVRRVRCPLRADPTRPRAACRAVWDPSPLRALLDRGVVTLLWGRTAQREGAARRQSDVAGLTHRWVRTNRHDRRPRGAHARRRRGAAVLRWPVAGGAPLACPAIGGGRYHDERRRGQSWSPVRDANGWVMRRHADTGYPVWSGTMWRDLYQRWPVGPMRGR